MLNEFKKFILRGSVVDLAVGIAVGAAFTTFVNSLVKDLVTPLVSAFYKGEQFAQAKFVVGGAEFHYGDLINSFITFVVVAAVIFFFVIQPINKLSDLAFRSKSTDEPTSKKCHYCLGKIPREATKCMYCTSDQPKAKQ